MVHYMKIQFAKDLTGSKFSQTWYHKQWRLREQESFLTVVFLSKMPGGIKKNIYRKERKTFHWSWETCEKKEETVAS